MQTTPRTESICRIVQEVLVLLAEKRYADLATLTRNVRLTSNDMLFAISQYGKEVILPPLDYISYLDIIKIQEEDAYSVWTPLWTKEEGMSDLTLQLTVSFSNEKYVIDFDNIKAS